MSANETSSVIASTSQSFISVFIRFVNESVLKINVNPADTVLVIKQLHFGKELSNNKVVRFIYQGQFLKDSNTLESYNIRDQTTIHCHITSRQTMANDSSSATTTATNQPIATTIQRVTPAETMPPVGSSSSQDSVNSVMSANLNASSSSVTGSSAGVSATASNISASRLNSNRNSLTNIEYGTILLPLLTILLASAWFFRINFKQFFSPLYNLFLVFITFVYAAFLIVHLYRIFHYVNRHPNSTRVTAPQVN